MRKFYGARFEPLFEKLRELNSEETVSRERLTLFNDAYIKTADTGEYKGKKNYRFVVGSSDAATSIDDRIYLYCFTHNIHADEDHRKRLLERLGPDLNWHAFNRHAAISASYIVFDSSDRSLYVFSADDRGSRIKHEGGEAPIFIDAKCNFSSNEFENAIELTKNVVYKINYLERELEEILRCWEGK